MPQQLKNFQVQYETLLALTHSKPFREADIHQLCKMIVKKVATLLKVERVGIWWFDEEKTMLSLGCGYLLSEDKYWKGDQFPTSSCPAYAQAVVNNRSLIVEDVSTHNATKDFFESYLKPAGITSMCDSSVVLGKDTVGVLCLEHVGEKRSWEKEEVRFAESLTDVLCNTVALKKSINAETNYKATLSKYKEANITLKNVLSRIEDEKKSMNETIAYNVETSLKPLLLELKKGLEPSKLELISQLEEKLNGLTSSFMRNLITFNTALTPTELKIIDLVRGGLRAKEIAAVLKLSVSTIETHKKNIRKKLNLTNQSINLKSYLDMISSES